jgi:hypothetical protein
MGAWPAEMHGFRLQQIQYIRGINLQRGSTDKRFKPKKKKKERRKKRCHENEKSRNTYIYIYVYILDGWMEVGY